MTQDEIIEMARQAGFETQLRKGKILGFDRDGDYTEELEAFAKLVDAKATAKEREACASICDDASWPQPYEIHSDSQWAAKMLAVSIRARGQQATTGFTTSRKKNDKT